MRTPAILAAMVFAYATPGFAASSPMFEQFERLCLSTRAQPVAVAKTVAGGDWTTAKDFPKALLPAYGGPFDQVTVRSRPAPDDDSFLLVSGTRGWAEGNNQVCTLSGPFDAAAIPALQAWLGGIKPLHGAGPDGFYTILETATGRRAATKLETQDAANRDRLMTLVVAIVADEIITLSAFVAADR